MKIICVGRNYAAHARELNNPVNEEPVLFLKPESALITGRQPFFIPDFSKEVHHEIELVLRICRTGKRIEERFASRYFDAITVGIDFTARDIQSIQKAKGLPWEIAKAFDGSAAVGQFIPITEVDIDHLEFSLSVNQTVRQRGNSRMMIFSFSRIISCVSHYFTLKAGDLIFTGTPEGVAAVQKDDKLEGYMDNRKLLTLKVK